MTGTDMLHVPYKGGGPAVTDVIAGQVHMTFGNMPTVLPHVRSGKVRALAVTSAKRSSELPAVPTVIESGYPGFEVTVWYGLCAPTATGT